MGSKTVEVHASKSWQDTGVKIYPNELVKVAPQAGSTWRDRAGHAKDAGGQFTGAGNAPTGLQNVEGNTDYAYHGPGAVAGQLIGSIGNDVFPINHGILIGDSSVRSGNEDIDNAGSFPFHPLNTMGDLELRINDGDRDEHLGDNSGSIMVNIRW
ncbi:hypothetical protein [Streptomyces sp. NPDC023838]|uniref:hypothetical protein n=1 Tax=Streptomyces sp. NPDC023838 TaxID=3154325 RepID=UPI0033E06B32